MIRRLFLIMLMGGLFWVGCRSTIAPDLERAVATQLATSEPVVTLSTPEEIFSENNADLSLTDAEIDTLLSLEEIDAYPLYTMRFIADYDIALLEQSPALANRNPDLTVTWACSLFAALADPESRLFGRNFDWEYSPALLLYTDPPVGYASVSMVDIAYLGYGDDNAGNLVERPLAELKDLLFAPYMPFDGFNEAGLAIGMAAVPPGNVPDDPHKPTLGSLRVIRAVLDGAATIDEALAIMQSYNIDFAGGPAIHYLVADQQGSAALLEHQGGKVNILYNQQSWHQATNFLNSAVDTQEGHCSRYDTIYRQLSAHQGSLGPETAMDLLQDVSQQSTQWSIIYGMNTGDIQIAVGGDYQNIHELELEMMAP